MKPFIPSHKMYFPHEIKYGEKIKSRGGKPIPVALDYFKVVKRTRSGDLNNFTLNEDVHKIIGAKPTEIPVQFASDDENETFSLFRGAFDTKKGQLMCGNPVGNKLAFRRIKMKDLKPNPSGVGFKGGSFVTPLEVLDEPFSYSCNEQCSLWKADKCKIFGKLHLFVDTPALTDLCLLRVSGAFARMSISASIGIIKGMSHGMLAGIPLKLCLHKEKLNKPVAGFNGKSFYPTIPYVTIQPRLSPSAHQEAVLKEMERRHKINEWVTNTPMTHRLVKGVFRSTVSADEFLNDSSSLTQESDKEEVFDSEEDAPPVEAPQDARTTLLLERFDGDQDKVDEHLQKEKATAFGGEGVLS